MSHHRGQSMFADMGWWKIQLGPVANNMAIKLQLTLSARAYKFCCLNRQIHCQAQDIWCKSYFWLQVKERFELKLITHFVTIFSCSNTVSQQISSSILSLIYPYICLLIFGGNKDVFSNEQIYVQICLDRSNVVVLSQCCLTLSHGDVRQHQPI